MKKRAMLATLAASLCACALAKRQELELDFIATCEAGNLVRAQEMLAADASLIDAKRLGRRGGVLARPLHAAAGKGHLELVKLLLERGADVRATAYSRQTALHEAAGSGRIEVVRLLLDKGADVNAREVTDGTPLHAAAASKDPEVAGLLIDRGANVNARESYEGATPLHNAVYQASLGGAAVLCASGADLSAKDKQGRTPLQRAEAELAERRRNGSSVDAERRMLDFMQPGGPCARLAEARAKQGKLPLERLRMLVAEQQCDSGDAASCADTALALEEGKGLAKDEARAAAFYEKGCEGGRAWSCSRLGSMYEKGRGVKKDEARAAALYKKACDQASAWACSHLGDLYEDGRGVSKDLARALALYDKGCAGGNAWGCGLSGRVYAHGLGVPPDPARAAALYQRACDGGDAWACKQLEKR